MADVTAQLGDRLHSFYLRGSVPRGRAIAGLSDLDSLAVTHQPLTETEQVSLQQLSRQLSRRYLFCRRVEIAHQARTAILTSGWAAVLATQGLHLWGENLLPALPPAYPGPDLMSHLPTLERDLARAIADLRQLDPRALDYASRVRARGSWLARRLVRAGFELVMAREGQFTRDLGLCYERFAAYYPERAPQMESALQLALRPTSQRAGLLLFGNQLGAWLVATRDRDVHRDRGHSTSDVSN